MRIIITLSILIGGVLAAPAWAQQGDKLIVHEWGTFTSLQDENGDAIGGINTDDEELPRFVHSLRGDLVRSPAQSLLSKGFLAKAHPDVTMRLETPVVYFYPPKQSPQMSVNMKVDFRGGWLSQFYPYAEVSAPGLDRQNLKQPGRITDETVGSLAWRVHLGMPDAKFPETKDRVWTAPREVPAAAPVSVMTVAAGGTKFESEKFLFYRGVGHVESPLRVKLDEFSLYVYGKSPWFDGFVNPPEVRHLWLVDVNAKGEVAFEDIAPRLLVPAKDDPGKPVPGIFRGKFSGDGVYSAGKLSKLRSSMRDALVKDGLYPDEAEAMLNTWEASYFKRPGLRLFYLVPRPWTDRVLPIEISEPAQIERVMIGRIEIVTPQQRKLLAKLGTKAPPTQPWLYPRAYVDLGRFAHPLVLAEQALRPNANLEAFIKSKQLDPFELK